MTTTITLAPDVEVRVRALMRRRGLTFSDAVNEAVRQGLDSAEENRRIDAPPRSRRDSRTGGADGRPDALAAKDVRSRLVQNLVDDIHAEPFQPSHRRSPYGPEVIGWPQRLRSYFWPNPSMTYERTDRLMAPWFEKAGELSRRLLDVGSWSDAERERATELVIEVLRWGGVYRQTFSPAEVEPVFRRSIGQPNVRGAPMNSGWSKVAAMATAYREGNSDPAPHVIWDSRVSTSLTSRLDPMLVDAGVEDPKYVFPRIGAIPGQGGTRPRLLRLRWAHAWGSWTSQEAGSELVREIRDLLNRGDYPAMPSAEGGEKPWTIRGVESVLFMDGY